MTTNNLDYRGYLHIRDINDWGINFNKSKRDLPTKDYSAQDLIDEVDS
jgi:hypothetical protein